MQEILDSFFESCAITSLIGEETRKRKRVDKGKEEDTQDEPAPTNPQEEDIVELRRIAELPPELAAKIFQDLLSDFKAGPLWNLMAFRGTRPLLYAEEKRMLDKINAKPPERRNESEKRMKKFIQNRWAVLFLRLMEKREDVFGDIPDPILDGMIPFKTLLDVALRTGTGEAWGRIATDEKYANVPDAFQGQGSEEKRRLLELEIIEELPEYLFLNNRSKERMEGLSKVLMQTFRAQKFTDVFLRELYFQLRNRKWVDPIFAFVYRELKKIDVDNSKLLDLLTAVDKMPTTRKLENLEKVLIMFGHVFKNGVSLNMRESTHRYGVDTFHPEDISERSFKIAETWLRYVEMPANFIRFILMFKKGEHDKFLELAYKYQPENTRLQVQQLLSDENYTYENVLQKSWTALWEFQKRHNLRTKKQLHKMTRELFSRFVLNASEFKTEEKLNKLLEIAPSAGAITNSPLVVLLKQIEFRTRFSDRYPLMNLAQVLVMDGRSQLDADAVTSLLRNAVQDGRIGLMIAILSMYDKVLKRKDLDAMFLSILQNSTEEVDPSHLLLLGEFLRRGIVSNSVVSSLNAVQRKALSAYLPYKEGIVQVSDHRRPVNFLIEQLENGKEKRLKRGKKTQAILEAEGEDSQPLSLSPSGRQLGRKRLFQDDKASTSSSKRISSCVCCGAEDPFFVSQEGPVVSFCKDCVQEVE